MLPWRVQLQRTLESFRTDAAFRNRLLGFMLVLVVLVGSFASGLTVNIEIGRTSGDEELTNVAAPSAGGFSAPSTGPTESSDRVATGAPSGSTGAPSTDQPSASEPAPDTEAAAPPGAPENTGASEASYDELLAQQLDLFTRPMDCEGANPTASDQGVTPETIKLGWLIPNLNELRAAGFDVGLAGDWDRIISAWVNELNRLGGWCREVTFVKEVFDVLSVDDMIAKCKAMTEDHKVFAVFTPGGYDSVAQLCIARDHKVPFINSEPEPEGWYEESAPYLWNMLMTKDRTHRNHVRWLVESQTVTSSHSVGVVYHDIPNVGPSVRDAMLPELTAGGIVPEEVVALSSDDEQAIAQINQVVVQFQQAGIDFVFMPMNLIFKSQFMQQAEQQGYFPEYTDSDHYFGCFDFVTATYAAESWDGTKCVTSLDVAGWTTERAEQFAAEHPYAKYADEVYLRSFEDGYDRDGEANEDTANTQRALFIGTGEQVLFFKQAADRVGVDLTRPRLGEELGNTGRYCTIVRFQCISFGPQKWDGPDFINVQQWFAEAADGYDERTYHQIIEPFPAYY